MTLRLATLAAALALVAAPAFAQTAAPTTPGTQSGMTGNASQAMRDAMDRMHRDMQAMQMTGDADRDWAMMMRRHHQAAVEMSRAHHGAGRDAEATRMAQKVIEDQTREIAQLDDWMRRHPR